MKVVEKCEEVSNKKVTYEDLPIGTIFTYGSEAYMKLRDQQYFTFGNNTVYTIKNSPSGWFIGYPIIVKPNARLVLD